MPSSERNTERHDARADVIVRVRSTMYNTCLRLVVHTWRIAMIPNRYQNTSLSSLLLLLRAEQEDRRTDRKNTFVRFSGYPRRGDVFRPLNTEKRDPRPTRDTFFSFRIPKPWDDRFAAILLHTSPSHLPFPWFLLVRIHRYSSHVFQTPWSSLTMFTVHAPSRRCRVA